MEARPRPTPTWPLRPWTGGPARPTLPAELTAEREADGSRPCWAYGVPLRLTYERGTGALRRLGSSGLPSELTAERRAGGSRPRGACAAPLRRTDEHGRLGRGRRGPYGLPVGRTGAPVRLADGCAACGSYEVAAVALPGGLGTRGLRLRGAYGLPVERTDERRAPGGRADESAARGSLLSGAYTAPVAWAWFLRTGVSPRRPLAGRGKEVGGE